MSLQESKCELSRRGFAFHGIVAAGASAVAPSVISKPSEGQFHLHLAYFDLFCSHLCVFLSVFVYDCCCFS